MTVRGTQEAARRALVAQRVGADLRLFREATGLPLAAVAEVFGWGRDALSKIERGQRPIGLYELLTLVHYYRDVAADHPAAALARRYLPTTRPPSGRG